MRRLLREPLLHFFGLGVLLFLLYGWVHRGAPAPVDEIVVDRDRVAGLEAQFQRLWQRPPTTQEREALVETWIREEVLYRVGLTLGLDRDDQVVRRRIAQKMEFVADGETPAQPTEVELQAWLDAHPDDYRVEPTYSFRQVYFDPARREDRLDADLAAARLALARGTAPVSGDATLLPGAMDSTPASEVARVFGPEFAQTLDTLAVGRWHGPVRSGYGVHLVELRARQRGHLPALADVRRAVERDLLQARAAEAGETFYRSLRQRYTVRIEDDVDVPAVAATSVR